MKIQRFGYVLSITFKTSCEKSEDFLLREIKRRVEDTITKFDFSHSKIGTIKALRIVSGEFPTFFTPGCTYGNTDKPCIGLGDAKDWVEENYPEYPGFHPCHS